MSTAPFSQLSNFWHYFCDEFDEDPALPELLIKALIKASQKWPNELDHDLFKNYQKYLALSEKEFRANRSMQHQLRIICSHYLMRKHLIYRRHHISNEVALELRLLPTHLCFSFGQNILLPIKRSHLFTEFFKLLTVKGGFNET